MTVIQEIQDERRRQIEDEGWAAAHDDQHMRGELALAAGCYCFWQFPSSDTSQAARNFWPWADHWFKPKDMRRDLIRAAALLVAEIERLDRVTHPSLIGAADGDATQPPPRTP